ncbi:MAG: 50S ribosomal protein L13 [Coprothermobacterota bacterium]|nr:50S ribosomal protein L13 [Coprothermobacterota bacterium]
MKTYVPKQGEITKQWYHVDAKDQTLGRLATRIARTLMGKHKPEYTPFLDVGDFVIVTNAELVRVTGAKMEQKIYFHYSGYPGGLKRTSLKTVLARHPDRVIREAVRLMLPKTTLGRDMLKKLKVYPGAEHPHAAQTPQPFG